MLMSPNLNVNAVLVEQVFESKEMCKWQPNSNQCLAMRAIIIVFITTVHRTMTKCYDPRSQSSIKRLLIKQISIRLNKRAYFLVLWPRPSPFPAIRTD